MKNLKPLSVVRCIRITLLLLASVATIAQALTPKQQYEIDRKQASAQYADDRAFCIDDADARERAQCLRDARSDYKAALTTAKNQLTTATAAAKNPANRRAAVCTNCGRVLSVNLNEKKGEGGALGIIAGGVTGALLGNQVGKGNGRDLATIAGAAGGAYAGNRIEKNVNSSSNWIVNVRFDDGSERSFEFDHEPGLVAGDLVRGNGDTISKR